MKVRDAMTRSVAACTQDETLNRAAQLMWDNDCGCVPVLDQSGAVTGIITDRDVCMGAYTQGLPLRDISVRSAMSTVVVSCSPEDSVESALALMRQNKIRRLPVTDGGRPVGILSLGDVMRVLRSSRQDRRPEGTPGEVWETFAVICEPGTAARVDGGRRESRDAPKYASAGR